MKKTIFIIAIVLALGILAFVVYKNKAVAPTSLINNNTNVEVKNYPDAKNIAYTFGGDRFMFKDGKAQDIKGDPSVKGNALIFGEPVYGDLTGDNISDAAVLIVNGTLYYAALAINIGTNDKPDYLSTSSLLLGDGITPQGIEIRNNQAIYSYTKPSVQGVSAAFFYYDKSSGQIKPGIYDPHVSCTQEAKVCPDGSYVSRTGPNCEFAPCPKEILIPQK